MYENMLDVNLVGLGFDSPSREDLFKKIANELKKKGYVNSDYLDALEGREKSFPTGLRTNKLNISLPHSDPEFVSKPFIYIAKNNNPLKVLQMGDNEELDCKYFFFLGIKEPDKQVGLLSKFMELFSEDSFVEELKQVQNEEKMYQLIKNGMK